MNADHPALLIAQLDISHNMIGGYPNEYGRLISTPEGPKAIADALLVHGALMVANLLYNELDVESANILV